jgi:hypothetical protein
MGKGLSQDFKNGNLFTDSGLFLREFPNTSIFFVHDTVGNLEPCLRIRFKWTI